MKGSKKIEFDKKESDKKAFCIQKCYSMSNKGIYFKTNKEVDL